MGRLQTARLENFIRRWGSIKGGGSILSETLGDVFPILDLENLTPENHLTAGWNLFCGQATVVGVAAQLAGLQLTQPAGRTSLVVVDKIIVNAELAQDITFGVNLTPRASIINTNNKDTRNAQAFNANAIITGNANMGVAALGGIIAVAAATDRELEAPNGLGVLGPGGSFSVVCATVNSDLTVTFFGRERQAEPSELSF